MKKLYKFPPCSVYDVPAMETWLSDLAQTGLLLLKPGRHLYVFQKMQPDALSPDMQAAARYRLEPIPGGCRKPADDMLDDYASAGWEFVSAADRSFFIWRSMRADAEELHSDPFVQGTAHVQLCRRLSKNTAAAVMLPAVIFIMFLCGMLLSDRPVTLFLASPSIALLIAADTLSAILRRFRQSLADGIPAGHYKDYKKGLKLRSILSFCLSVLLLVLISMPVFIFTFNWKKSIANTGTPLPYLPLELIEQDTGCFRPAEPYMRGGVDARSCADYSWTLFAPVHYDIYQEGRLDHVYQNPDNDMIAVCPSARTEYFQLSLPFLAVPLYHEQIQLYTSRLDPRAVTEPEHPGFDHITIACSGEYAQLFACRGNQVIHIQYWGNAGLTGLLDELSAAFDAAKSR